MDRRRFLLTSLAGALAAPVVAETQRDMRIDKFVALLVVASFLAGCGGISPSRAWQAHCPQGNYAPQSLDEWFRSSSEVIQGRRGPQVEGYIYNNFSAGAEQMLVGVEQLSPSGQAVGCLMVWVSGIVPPGDRAYFVAPVPDASAKYRVRILSFNWANKGGHDRRSVMGPRTPGASAQSQDRQGARPHDSAVAVATGRSDHRINHLPYLLPWVRVLLLIRSITSTTWGHEAWPEVKPVLGRALEMRRQIAREGWWN